MLMNIIAFDLGGSSGKIFLGEYAGKKLRINLLHHFDHSAVSLGSHLFWEFIRNYVTVFLQQSMQQMMTLLLLESTAIAMILH